MFRFLHAADLHLDSSPRGLQKYDGAPTDLIRQATRQALANLVQLAIDERVDFVLIAGDVYDSDWPDYNTGLHFVSQVSRLREAGIPAYLIAGNHDAANKMTRSLTMPDGVKRLGHDRAETVLLNDLGVAIHGQGFATQAVYDNLAVAFPDARTGLFNIGLLHTCADDGNHERYAPCTVDELKAKGYDYWALGHVHQRRTLSKAGDPPIVFPGNTQGRHIGESGKKGCVIVTVDDSHQASLAFHPLDVLRWGLCNVSAAACKDGDEVLDRFAQCLKTQMAEADDVPLALRVRIDGACPAHGRLHAKAEHWINEMRSVAVDLGGGRVWLEKVQIKATPVNDDSQRLAEGPLGELSLLIQELRSDPTALAGLGECLNDLRRKLPADFQEADEPALGDPVWLAELLDQVEPLLVDRLMAQGATG